MTYLDPIRCPFDGWRRDRNDLEPGLVVWTCPFCHAITEERIERETR